MRWLSRDVVGDVADSVRTARREAHVTPFRLSTLVSGSNRVDDSSHALLPEERRSRHPSTKQPEKEPTHAWGPHAKPTEPDLKTT